MEDYTRRLFARGQEIAARHGLILVDTKYEFGKRDGQVYLIDEIHTPDSSRYFYADGYEENLASGKPQRHYLVGAEHSAERRSENDGWSVTSGLTGSGDSDIIKEFHPL